MTCQVCHSDKPEGRKIDLYVYGSEGLNICHDCEMLLVDYVRKLSTLASRARLAEFKDGKKLGEKR